MSSSSKRKTDLPTGHARATDEAIRAALAKSGYLLEARIEKRCLEADFEVQASRRIADPHDRVAREMDLLAEFHEGRTLEQSTERPSLAASLIIECKNNFLPVAFLEKDITWAEHSRVPTLLGVPLNVPEKVGGNGFFHLEDQARVSWRWQLSRWATQFCNFNPRGTAGELEACQNHDYHGTFEKLLAAAEGIADEVMRPGLIEAGVLGGALHLIRPVVVLQGRLIAVFNEGKDEKIEDRDHVRYLRKSVINDRRLAWVVDVVTESGFPDYLRWVRETLERVGHYCIENREVVQDAFQNQSTRRLALSMRTSAR